MAQRISGILTPNITPVDAKGRVDEDQLRGYIDWLIERGVDGIYPNGSTGEFVRFNADEWADLMVESGQKFLVITSKHHDGFCLWDSALTEFKVTNTSFGRDILHELAEALHAR